MKKTTTISPLIFRLLTLALLGIILGYQLRLDARLSRLETKTKQAAGSAAATEQSIEEVKKELNAVMERLGI
ncbi:hypothetical protein [Spirosoma pulveris]